jgi:hypothetical protein
MRATRLYEAPDRSKDHVPGACSTQSQDSCGVHASQNTDRHWVDLPLLDDARRPQWTELDIDTATALSGGADQTSTQKIGKSGILDSTNDLAPIGTQSRKHLDEVKRSEVVDVLHGIVQQERSQRRPCASQVDRQQKRETRCAALATAEDKLGVQTVAHLQA